MLIIYKYLKTKDLKNHKIKIAKDLDDNKNIIL
jgi:hypothetical protein